VITDVPPNATVVGVPGRIGLGFSAKEIKSLEHGKLPDPIADAIRFVIEEQKKIEERISKVEKMEGIISKIDERIEQKRKEIEEEFKDRTSFSNGGGI